MRCIKKLTMKNICFILLLLISVSTFSQEHVNFSLKLGQNFSKVDNVLADKSNASFHVGLVSEIRLTKTLSIAPEVILSQTKLEASPSIAQLMGNGSLQPETYHLNYISFPVLLQVRPLSKLSIELGPQYSVLMSQSKDGSELARMAFKNGEFAMVGGATLHLGGFAAYGRYVAGMQDINALQDQNKWQTRQWQLGVRMSLFGF